MPRTIAFFDGSTNAVGGELWETDGTAAGSVLVADIVPGPASSAPSNFAPAGAGAVAFTANDGGPNGAEVFASNGTAAGTVELNNSFVQVPLPFLPGGPAYTDPLGQFTPLGNGRTLFVGATSVNSLQVWSTDSTVAGTGLVKDLAGTNPSGDRVTIGVLGNGRAVFEVSSISSARGLWVTDGTAAGTAQVSSFGDVGGPSRSSITPLGNGEAITTTPTNGAGAVALGVTDGTVAGTATIRGFTHFGGATAIGGGKALLAVTADGQAGTLVTQLWVTDGTAAGTTELVQGPAPGTYDPGGFAPHSFTPLGDGRFVFVANDGNAGNALWVTDGTVAGTALVQEIGPPGTMTFFIYDFAALGSGRVLFEAQDYATSNTALLVTDGTAAGTTELQGFAAASRYSATLGPVAVLPNGTAVFSFADSTTGGLQIWRTDGTAAGTAQVASVPSSGDRQANFTVVLPDGRAVFPVTNADRTSTLWATSGTAAGTGPVANVATGYNSFGLATVADLDPLFDSNYYNAHNPDVAAAGLNAFQHYLAYGGAEGRSPDPLFDSKLYLAQNPDVAASGINPLLHFETYGWHEGRDPSLLFSDSKYLAANPDVAAAGLDPLQHYLQYGQAEGRPTFLSGGTEAADPLVQPAFYDPQLGASLIPTGAAASQQAAWSYDMSGWQKGLNPDALFDTGYYLAHNPDVAAAHVNPLLHYEQYGWHERRNPSDTAEEIAPGRTVWRATLPSA